MHLLNRLLQPACLLMLAVLLAGPGAHAALTDIANTPLANTSAGTKPNIMLLLDDSGSMDSEYLPDIAGSALYVGSAYIKRASQCNGLAYNPGVTYTAPVKADGSYYPNWNASVSVDDGFALNTNTQTTSSSAVSVSTGSKTVVINYDLFGTYNTGDTVLLTQASASSTTLIGTVTNAVTNWGWVGFLYLPKTQTLTINVTYTTGSGSSSNWQVTKINTVNLAGNILSNYYYSYSGNLSALAWKYTSSGGADVLAAFNNECFWGLNTSLSPVFSRQTISASNSTESQNYGNWYAYYRTRINMMKTSLGFAFQGLDSNYRVGFSTISDTTATASSTFLHASDFDTTQKATFYSDLYAIQPNGATPLRGALAKMGRYYAKKVSGQTVDPVVSSCQRNYTLLTTDGYWNDADANAVKLDGMSTVGQQDNAEARPMYDAGLASNTLADVAAYYYKTDLRTTALSNCTGGAGTDVCANQVPSAGRDTATWQHMTTFTLGLGVAGLLTYDKNYLTQTSGSYYAIKTGAANWPSPSADNPATVDDLWHAAVNGRGQYFSASSPLTLSESLNGMLAIVNQAIGTGGATGSTSMTPVDGSDLQLSAQYQSSIWSGDVLGQRYQFNSSGSTTLVTMWSAQGHLESMTPANRVIYYMHPASAGSGTRALRAFSYSNLSTDGRGGYFSSFCTQSGGVPAQCAYLNTAQKTLANDGTNLVNWLRGDRTYEQTSTANPLFRTRASVLGDIINSTPTYVGKPPFKYVDAGYASYATSQASRQPMVYVGANDGMLHAFYASGTNAGVEAWAFIPSAVMPNLYKLADTAYPNNHRYYVDGAPVVGDIKVGNSWKTILVGGLNAGGKSYYALDITDPATPVALWEFNETDLGLSFGNPIITKRANGTWVVAFSSGYNNTGNGYLYVLNANTGTQLFKIATLDASNQAVGSATTPSGLGRINAWVDAVTDNTALRFYGGDLLGNLWRFDIDNNVNPHQAAQLLATFKVNNTPQPITTRPELAYADTNHPVVYVGTGRYLGLTDVSDTATQSLYAIRDPLTNTSWGNVRSNSGLLEVPLPTSTTSQTTPSATINWSGSGTIGWYADFTRSGQRVNVDPKIQYNWLAVIGNIPGTGTCTPSGSSITYVFDIGTGKGIVIPINGEAMSNALGTGISWISTANGPQLSLPQSDGSTPFGTPPSPTTTQGVLRRSSWRELVN